MEGIRAWLKFKGFQHVHNLRYNVEHQTVDESVKQVDVLMQQHADKENQDPVAIIGQSMGGVVAMRMHKEGWNVAACVTVASPLHGANLLNQLEYWLPECIKSRLRKIPHEFLKSKEKQHAPTHPYRTISAGWLWSDFDGCVYKSEAVIDPMRNTHLSCADHRSVFANPRLWHHVHKSLQACLDEYQLAVEAFAC
jgi:pimeloyl-ACP methyl ester carboxylesterase